jgi:hypothetical protein
VHATPARFKQEGVVRERRRTDVHTVNPLMGEKLFDSTIARNPGQKSTGKTETLR